MDVGFAVERHFQYCNPRGFKARRLALNEENEMSLFVVYKSKNYSPELVKTRYVRAISSTPGEYGYAEVGEDPRYDLLQGIMSAEDIPLELRSKADKLKSQAFGYVEWPL